MLQNYIEQFVTFAGGTQNLRFYGKMGCHISLKE